MILIHTHTHSFSQIGSRSSVYSPESSVRKTGSYIYEEFMPTDGTDVKVKFNKFTKDFIILHYNVFYSFIDESYSGERRQEQQQQKVVF